MQNDFRAADTTTASILNVPGTNPGQLARSGKLEYVGKIDCIDLEDEE
jgi:hypothetical protein